MNLAKLFKVVDKKKATDNSTVAHDLMPALDGDGATMTSGVGKMQGPQAAPGASVRNVSG